LSNGGERIALVGPLGEVLQDFVYDDAAPWPAQAGGGGYSIEIIDPLGDPENPSNWRASHYYGGSPGGDGLPLMGDYDRNGVVNQTDYQRWRQSYGLTVPPGMGADGNGNGAVDTADFILWRRGMNSPAASFAVMAAATASPAPAVATPSPERPADVQDRAFAALFTAREANSVVARPLARVRPAFRPAMAADTDRQPMAQLLLDIALSDHAIDEAGSDPVTVRPTADGDGDADACELLNRLTDDVLFGL
jgi:hypothetical protein